MFSVQIKKPFQIILENSSKTTRAVLVLNEGSRVKDLSINGINIIQEQKNFEYTDSYASSILFPFASRVKNGTYTFEGKTYQLVCNKNSAALHGLVYNKTFEVISFEEGKDYCSVTLNYIEKSLNKGFPFLYTITVKYTLYNDKLSVKVIVKNIGDKTFPFTLGWHPYFCSTDLNSSFLEFEPNKKVVFDEDLITKEIKDYNNEKIFKVGEEQLDDCFFLNENHVSFTTPEYKIAINSSADTNFLQLYTPPNRNTIAIEPMTGISNSFNNKIGLQTLEPNRIYDICWNVVFKKV